jgi:membrane associated rhomboid family serine protease
VLAPAHPARVPHGLGTKRHSSAAGRLGGVLMEQFLDFLDKLGIRTQKLRWKLYQWEQRRKDGRSSFRLPVSLHWLTYPHKVCLECGAVAARDARTCESCGRPLPSMFSYKVFRLGGLVVPRTAQTTITAFMVVMVLLFGLELMRPLPETATGEGPQALWQIAGWNWTLLYSPGEYWRLLACGLIHAGLIHIGFNLLALSSIGPMLEDHVGRSRMLVIITVTQVTSAILVTLSGMARHGGGLTVGASGWLFGLIGFGIAYFHTMGKVGSMYRNMLIKWAGYALLFGFLMPGVSNSAHIGGLIGGLALGFLPEPHPHRTRLLGLVWDAGFWVSAVLWLGTLAMLGHAIGFRGFGVPGT